jgi:hypothetical protein
MRHEERNYNRRAFLSKSIKGIVAGGILGKLTGNALSYHLADWKYL